MLCREDRCRRGIGKDSSYTMKQKYAITVADMELNIISDASPDEVENIVSILDRRMRDINLKSPRCTKNEAAILCALSYCSERIAMQEAFKKVEKDAFRFAGENEKLKQTIESMQLEMDNLRKDAAVMRSILDRASITAVAPTPSETEAKKPEVAPEEPKAPVEPEAAPIAPVEEESQKKNTKPQKNRVGTMFDLLTFSDV